MGFSAGFTGGVTITLSLAYLAIATHQRNRQTQADILRSQNSVLSSLIHDPSAPRPVNTTPYAGLLTREEKDHHFVETAKTKWNSEIENAVRWAQTKDWDATREWAESLIFGSPAADKVKTVVRDIQDETVREPGEVRSAGRAVLQDARRKSVDLAHTARDRAVHMAGEGRVALAHGVERSKEVVHAGVEKGRDMAHRASEGVQHAEKRVGDLAHKKAAEIGLMENRIEHKIDKKLLGYNAVDRALAQRYESDGGKVMTKSVEEVLRERYTPVEKQDHKNLRGL